MNNEFDELFQLLDDIPTEKQNDTANEKISDESFEEFIKEMETILGCSLEVTPEFEEKLKIVSKLEGKYTDTFGDILSCDAEYNGMSLDEKIQMIRECLDTNKPKNIVLEGCPLSDKEKAGILKNFKVFY